MGAGRARSYNPRTGTWVKPKRWYEKGRRRKKSGCYVATAVYGSYDCPEVWTLRRFRDVCLAKHFLGRVFIAIYYTVSPVFVRIFGKTMWFNKVIRKKLDVMVDKLNSKGYSAERYTDVNQ